MTSVAIAIAACIFGYIARALTTPTFASYDDGYAAGYKDGVWDANPQPTERSQ